MADGMQDNLDTGIADPPTSIRHAVACIPCLLIKTLDQFYNEGCENCPFEAGDDGRISPEQYVTQYFDGMVSILEPSRGNQRESWVARYMRVENFVAGCYAIKVSGQVDEEAQNILTEAGFTNLGKHIQEEDTMV